MPKPDMNSSNILSNKNIELLIQWNIYLIALLPATPNIINSIAIISWCGLMLIYNIFRWAKKEAREQPDLKKYFLLLGGNFLLLLLSLTYTADQSYGMSFLQTSVSMFAFPFFLFCMPYRVASINTKTVENTLQVFWAATLLLTIYLFIRFLQLDYLSHAATTDSFNNVFREYVANITDKHPIYASMYLLFSTWIAVESVRKNNNWPVRILYTISILLFLGMLLLLAARSPMIGALLAFILIFLWRIKGIKLKIIITTSFLAAMLLIVRFTPPIYSRVLEFQETALAPPVGEHHNSVNIRVGIIQCTWKLIKENYMFGIGVGDDEKALNDCYAGYPTDVYQKGFYNTHDQYANILLLTGIFALLLFVGSIVFLFYISIKNKNYTLLFFMTLTATTFFAENVLSRQGGVVFYYLFTSLIAYNIITRNRASAKTI